MSDYISRKAAVKIAQKYGLANGSALGRHTGLADCIAIEIEGLPAADVEPVRHGRWIPIRESEITGWNPEFAGRNPIGGYKCSECGEFAVFDCNDEYVLSDFCHNCGSKMDGGGEDG